MAMPVIETEALTKVYRRRGGKRTVALDGLNLSVPEGGVFGLLGPNGSGKTTTIRCVLGLVHATSGRARLLGATVPGGLPTTIHRVGAIVETPALFPTMTARENLRLLGAIDGIGAASVEQVLERVGLASRADDDVRKFSLGMRQRLGLGAALLKDPALLILDEPANGLDPAGIRETRELMRSLGDEGRTVLVSSHLLAEVEQTCDSIAIVKRGRSVVAGTVDAVLGTAAAALVVRVDDLRAGADALRRAGFAVEPTGDMLRITGDPDAAHISRTLAGEQLWVRELRAESHNLEDRFLELTADDVEADDMVEVAA
jgi:ABC-2 type transport system ATP-binding protein